MVDPITVMYREKAPKFAENEFCTEKRKKNIRERKKQNFKEKEKLSRKQTTKTKNNYVRQDYTTFSLSLSLSRRG